jgi:hypothetical protein
MTTVENTGPISNRVAGKRGLKGESHEPRLLLSQFLSPPPPQTEWDGTHGIVSWGMDGNDQYGCCGPAATDHGNVAKADNPGRVGSLGQPTFSGTLATYFAYGIAQGEQGPTPDQGVDNASWFEFLYKNKIIYGYGEVPLSQLETYAQLFDGIVLGVSLDDDAEQDFEATPPVAWGSEDERPDPSEGHDILLIKTHPQGATVVTWGALQEVTQYFLNNNVTDAWAFFDKDDAERAGINTSALEAALSEVHGTYAAEEDYPTPEPDSHEAPPAKEIDADAEIIAPVDPPRAGVLGDNPSWSQLQRHSGIFDND